MCVTVTQQLVYIGTFYVLAALRYSLYGSVATFIRDLFFTFFIDLDFISTDDGRAKSETFKNFTIFNKAVLFLIMLHKTAVQSAQKLYHYCSLAVIFVFMVVNLLFVTQNFSNR